MLLGCSDPPSTPGTTATTMPATTAAVTTAAPTGSAATGPVAPATTVTGGAFASAPVPAKTRVAVVGAGFAGLIAAYKLKKAGIEVHVLESQARIGGRVNTAYYPGGAQSEFGVQELWEDNPIYAIASKELGVKFDDPTKSEAGFSALYEVEDPAKPGSKKPKLFWYNDDKAQDFYGQVLTKDGKPNKEAYEALDKWLTAALELRKRALEKGLSDPDVARLQKMSFSEWVREAKLDPKAEELISMVLDCELATTGENYSALFGLFEYGIVLEGLRYYHATGGNHKIIDALAAAVGPNITTGARVLRLDLAAKDKPGPGEIGVHYMIDGHVGVLKADRVVLAIPWIRLHELDIRPGLSKEKWDALDGERDTGRSKRPQLPGLNRGRYVVIHLLVDRKKGEELWRDRKTNRTPFPILSNGKLGVIYGARGEGDPNAATEVFALLVYGEYANALHMQPVHRVESMVVEELERLWPGFGKIVQSTYVYSYHPAAVPVWPPGRSPIDDASKSLWKPERGLYLAGDYLVNSHSDGAARSAVCQSDRLILDLAGKPAPTGLCHYIPGSGH